MLLDLPPLVTETQGFWLWTFLLIIALFMLFSWAYRVTRQRKIEDAILEMRDILKEIRDQQKNRS